MGNSSIGSGPSGATHAAGRRDPRFARRARARSVEGGSESRPLLAALGRLGLSLAARLSPGVAYHLGGALGRFYGCLPTRSARAASVNLEICFPELSPRQRRALFRESFAHAGRCCLEFGRIWCGRDQGLPGIVREVRGQELIERARAQGKGVIVILPHLGCWEFLSVFMPRLSPSTCIYQPPRIRELEQVMRLGRERHGSCFAPVGASGVRALRRALERGEAACMLPDQDPGHGAGVFVPFFGHLANTGTLVGRLALRTGAPVVIVTALRVAGGRFDVAFGEVEAEAGSADPAVAAAAINRAVERCVRAAPEQYLWSYKRFRFQPPGTASPYKEAARSRGSQPIAG
jgi:KDO2-lipid IV(A) lauroyltransferase